MYQGLMGRGVVFMYVAMDPIRRQRPWTCARCRIVPTLRAERWSATCGSARLWGRREGGGDCQ